MNKILELEKLERDELVAYGEWKAVKEILEAMPFETHEDKMAFCEFDQKVVRLKLAAWKKICNEIRILKIEYIDNDEF